MGEINFVDTNDEHQRGGRKRRARVEYSSGEVGQAPTATDVSPAEAPQNESSFSAWRRKRREQKARERQMEQERAQVEQVSAAAPRPQHQPQGSSILLVEDSDDFLQQQEPEHVEVDGSLPRTSYVAPAPVADSAPTPPVGTPVVAQANAPTPDPQPVAHPVAAPAPTDAPAAPQHDYSDAFELSSAAEIRDHEKRTKKARRKQAVDDAVAHLTAGQAGEEIGGVNLLPSTGAPQQRPRSYGRLLVSVGLGAIVVVAGASLALRWMSGDAQQRVDGLYAQATAVDTQIDALSQEERSVRAIESELVGLESVLAQHTYWTPLFDLIEEQTLPTVHYTTMSGNALTGVFTFQAVTTDYGFVEPQVELFERSPFVDSVQVSAAAATIPTGEEGTDVTDTTVQFVMTVSFADRLFHPDRVALQP